jgi:FkbM family methyltransferase
MRYRIFPGYGHAYLYGGWERKSMDLMARYVLPGTTAYDLGANYGMHSLLLAKLVGPSGRVYAFEPHPEVRAALEEQLALNRLDRVETVPLAISDTVGVGQFDSAHHRGAGHLVPENTNQSGATTFEVATSTLDTFVFEGGNKVPDFIKIDIEGAESAALRGGREVITKHRPILLIELHNPHEDRAVGRFLREMGYGASRVETGETVKNMETGWPDRDGMWGSVIALPS